jgi:hypothetical protein
MKPIHDQIEEWMAAALCGGLSGAEQENFERHLAECEVCRALYREEQIMNTMLEKEVGAQRPEPEFGDAMVRRFREKVGTKRRGFGWLAVLGRVALSRPAQLVYAVLVVAAMVVVGSLITGEGIPVGRYATGSPEIASIQNAEAPAPEAMPAPTEKDANAPAPPPTEAQAVEAGGMLADGAAAPESSLDTDAQSKATTRGVFGMTAAAPALPGSEQQAQIAALAPPPGAAAGPMQPATPAAPSPEDQRKLIRNANVEYEVASYSQSVDTLSSLTAQAQGFVSTENSQRGANGKMSGLVEVKVPPDQLEAFLLKLRVLGDLKSQTLSTEDVTKDYFDTDARMRNSQEEEARLLDILNKDTGRLADVLQIERELARVRQSIEQMQGTLKYYNTMVQYATVSVTLSEKDLNAPAQFLLKQRDDLAIFAEDVDATFSRAKEVAASVKAQVLDSNLQRDESGQTTATLSLMIDPAAAEGAIAQLKALGRIQTFTSATKRVAQDGSGDSDSARTDRDNVEVHLTVQQDQETAAQQTNVSIEASGIEALLAQLKQKAATLSAEVKGASYQQDPSGTESGTMELRTQLRNYGAVMDAIKGLGKVTSLSTTRQEGATVNDTAPAEISVQINSQPQIVSPDDGVWATIRRTLGEAFGAVMWSVRMIGVSLAFFAPWLVALAAVIGSVKLVRRVRRKSE